MLFYLFDAKFTGLKFYRWRYDNWPIGQWVIFLVAPDTAYVNHFFPQLDLESSSLARPLATSCIEARFAHFEELIRGRLFSKSSLKRTNNGFCNTLEAKCFNLVPRAVSHRFFKGKAVEVENFLDENKLIKSLQKLFALFQTLPILFNFI